jgi:hypothetical protein
LIAAIFDHSLAQPPWTHTACRVFLTHEKRLQLTKIFVLPKIPHFKTETYFVFLFYFQSPFYSWRYHKRRMDCTSAAHSHAGWDTRWLAMLLP